MLRVLRVFRVREGVATTDVLRPVDSLPGGLVGDYDEAVQAGVVRGTGGPEEHMQMLRHFGQLRDPLVHGDPGSEEAILKYLPQCSDKPAAWDVLGEDWAICTTCYGLEMPPVSGRAELVLAMQRHTKRVHAGRQVDSPQTSLGQN